MTEGSSGRVCSPTGTAPSIPQEVADDLREISRQLASDIHAVEVGTRRRDAMIVLALQRGGSLRQVARLAGLTFAGVVYIRDREAGRP